MVFSLVIGILAACYGASRIMLRVGLFPGNANGLRAAHFSAAFAVLLLDVLLKQTLGGFSARAAVWVLAVQLGWYLLDLKRGRIPAAASG